MEVFRIFVRYLLAFFYILAGFNHFYNPNFYVNIMPDYMPLHIELVYVTGVIEMILGLMVLFRRTMRLGAYLIIAMLGVFLLVHVDMLVHAYDKYKDIPIFILWIRLPIQALLAYTIWWSTKR